MQMQEVRFCAIRPAQLERVEAGILGEAVF